MADTSSQITLDKIVNQLLLFSELPKNKFVAFKQLAIRGYRELNITTLQEGVYYTWNTLDSNYIVALDDEVVKVIDVFVPVNGEMWSLTRQDTIVPTTTLSNGSTTLDPDRGEGDDIYPVEGLGFASSGGINYEGYYTYDNQNRRLIFRNVQQLTEVLVMYTTSGVSLTEETYIPSYAEAAVTAYIRWQYETFKLKPNYNIVVSHKEEFERQKSICRGVLFNFSEFKDAVFSQMTRSFRRAD
jgi:hypothetical protein